MGVACTKSSNFTDPRLKFLEVDNAECMRRIFSIVGGEIFVPLHAPEVQDGDVKQKKRTRQLRRWDLFKDAQDGWYTRIGRYQTNLITKKPYPELRRLANMPFKYLRRQQNSRYAEFDEFVKELLFALFTKYKQRIGDQITVGDTTKIIGVLVFGSLFRKLLEAPQNKKKRAGSSITGLMAHLSEYLQDSVRSFCEEPQAVPTTKSRLNFLEFKTLMLRCMARNLDRSQDASMVALYCDLGNLLDDLLKDQEKEQIDIMEEIARILREYITTSRNKGINKISDVTIAREIKAMRTSDWELFSLPKELRNAIIQELEWIILGGDAPAPKRRISTSVPKLNIATAARRIVQAIRTELPGIGDLELAKEVFNDINIDTKPITITQRMSRLLWQLDPATEQLTWWGIDIVSHFKDKSVETSGNILFFPISLKAMLIMAEVASTGNTKAEIQKVIGSVSDYRLQNFPVLDDLFLGKGVSISFAHSLWVPQKYSTLYGNAVNTYVSGQVGSFRERSYYPKDKLTDTLVLEKPQRRRSSIGRSVSRQDNLAIDRWVKKSTNGEIEQVFGSVLHHVSGMLVATATLKAAWKYKFASVSSEGKKVPNPTIEQFPHGWFRVDTSHRMRCRFMTLQGVKIKYTTSRDALIVNLDFGANGMQALIAIPRIKKRKQVLKQQQQQKEEKRPKHHKFRKTWRRNVEDTPAELSWKNLYDPPSLRDVLMITRKKTRTLEKVFKKMDENAKKDKFVTELTLPMGKIDWTGNFKDWLRHERGIKELFEEDNAEISGALKHPTSYAHISGVVHRSRLELVPDGFEEPPEPEVHLQDGRYRKLRVDCPFLIVVHALGGSSVDSKSNGGLGRQVLCIGHVHTVTTPGVDGRVENISQNPWKHLHQESMEGQDESSDEE